jgi:hypothetical protein
VTVPAELGDPAAPAGVKVTVPSVVNVKSTLPAASLITTCSLTTCNPPPTGNVSRLRVIGSPAWRNPGG